MDDDFNTPEAMAILFELAREVNRLRMEQDDMAAAETGALLKRLAGILGLLERDASAWFKGEALDGLDAAAIEVLIQARLTARTNKNWAESDRIRDELKAKGILLEDKAGVTTWRRA
jgi:cysteinyl-tRNA synthetase